MRIQRQAESYPERARSRRTAGVLPPGIRIEQDRPNRVLAWDDQNTDPWYDDRPVGMLSWDDQGVITWVQIYEDEYQRRGIGTAMLDWARANVRSDIVHSTELSESGAAWSQSVAGRTLAQRYVNVGRSADKQRTVQDADYWGEPVGTPIVPGMKPEGESSGKGEKGESEESKAEKPPKAEKPSAPAKLSDKEYEQHLEKVTANVAKAIDAGEETNVKYAVNGVADTYTQDRRRQQRELLDGMWHKLGGPDVPREGKALMAGGLGGAGKSTVLGKHAGIDSDQYITVNPDDVKEAMIEAGMAPEVEGLSPMEAATLMHEESSYLATTLAYRAYEEGTNVIWDITMASPGSTARRIEEMREAGYDKIDSVFVDIPVETSVERAAARHRRGMEKHRGGEGPGGRYVPPEIIRKNKSDTHSSKNRETFEKLQDKFDDSVVYDNSVHGRDPVKMQGKGRWARLLAAGYGGSLLGYTFGTRSGRIGSERRSAMTTTRELMSQLNAGEITLEEAVEGLEGKSFPKAKKSSGTIDTTVDPAAPGPDDFFWVHLAYDQRQIDDDEYDQLAHAAGN